MQNFDVENTASLAGTVLQDWDLFNDSDALPLIVQFPHMRGGKFHQAELAATRWLLTTIENNSGWKRHELERIFAMRQSEVGDTFGRYIAAKHSPLNIITRDRIARISIKRGWLKSIDQLPPHPIRELAYGTTRGFNYQNFQGPIDQLSRAEKEHQRQSMEVIELQRKKVVQNDRKCREAKVAAVALLSTIEGRSIDVVQAAKMHLEHEPPIGYSFLMEDEVEDELTEDILALSSLLSKLATKIARTRAAHIWL
jgi:hypothetical protein